MTETTIYQQMINKAKGVEPGLQEAVEGGMPTLLWKMQALLERVGDSNSQPMLSASGNMVLGSILRALAEGDLLIHPHATRQQLLRAFSGLASIVIRLGPPWSQPLVIQPSTPLIKRLRPRSQCYERLSGNC
jgi:hypothetical protein